MKKNMIIVGAGLAGLSAALQAVKEGCSVKLISSLPSERAQSVMAEGGINAALNTKGEDDSTQEHYEDTIKAGCNLADPNAVWNMTQAAPEVVKWLHSIGVQFNTCGYDELDLRNFGGQKKKRTAFAKSDTGKQIMTAMIDAVRRLEVQGQIERFEHHSFRTLLMTANICHGCVVCDNYTGEIKMLISEAARGEGGRLFTYRDGNRWYFMEEKYPELGNLMPRDITAREIWKISKESPVYLDMTEIPKDVTDRKLAGLVSDCQIYLHKDIRKEPVQVVPGIHYFMGGIYVDEKHRTPVRNLYAAGECCAQYHGANRLGGNSLLGAIYGGRIAAQTACEDAMTAKDMLVTETQELADLCESISQPDKKKINKIMLNTLGVVRNRKRMEEELEKLCQIKGSLSLLGQAAIMSAIERTESRGAHYREDYPKKNDDFARTTIASYNGQKIQIHFEEIPERRQ